MKYFRKNEKKIKTFDFFATPLQHFQTLLRKDIASNLKLPTNTNY